MLVPGDRIVLAFDPTIPRPGLILDALGHLFDEAGIDPGSLAVLSPSGSERIWEGVLPDVRHRLSSHDPDDRAQLAYLASTQQGRRVYLSRSLTDADVVVPVGRIGFDSDLGHQGPWSVVFPGLSDRDTLRRFREGASSPQRTVRMVRINWYWTNRSK